MVQTSTKFYRTNLLSMLKILMIIEGISKEKKIFKIITQFKILTIEMRFERGVDFACRFSKISQGFRDFVDFRFCFITIHKLAEF